MYNEFLSSQGRILDAPYHPTHAKLALAQIHMEALEGFVHEKRTPGSETASVNSPNLTLRPSGLSSRGALPQPSTPLNQPYSSSLNLAMSPQPLAGGEFQSPCSAAQAAGDSKSISMGGSHESSPSSLSASSTAGGEVEAVVHRLKSALRHKWTSVGKVLASELDNATSPLLMSGRAGVSGELGSPSRLNVLPGKYLVGVPNNPSKLIQPASPLESTLRLGASVRGGGGSASLLSPASAASLSQLRRVPLPLFQRALSQQGLAFTPRDLRALSVKYGGKGGSLEGPATIDFEAIVRDAGYSDR